MRILIVSQYFWPEFFIINDVVQTLSSQGHSIKVLTGKPNYPNGKIFDGYTQQGVQEEFFAKDIPVFRAPLRPRKTAGAKNLFLNYWSFIWNGLRFFPAAVKNEQYDVIFVFAPSPITMAIPAIYLKWKLKTHLVIWVQDLWPESLSATGFIKNRLILRLVKYLVKAIYYFSDTLLVQSKAFIEPVTALSKGEKVHYFPNVINDDRKVGISESEHLSKELETVLDNHFCFMFAGNIGQAQSIETIICAAEKIQHISEIKLIIVGSGSALASAKRMVEQKQLHNVIFTGRYPAEVMPFLFSKAKGLLVTLRDQDIFSYTVPSKVQAYLCAGRPIIASINGEAARVIVEAKSGLVCSAEDSGGLADKMSELFYMSQAEREVIGENGRRYFLENFELKQKCTELIDILQQRIDIKRRQSA